MSFSNFEFPNTNFYNSDLRELLAMYKKLAGEYDGIKSEIDRAMEFINEFNVVVQQKVDEAVAKEFDAKLREIEARFELVNQQIRDLSSAVEQDKASIEELYRDFNVFSLNITNELDAMKKDIQNLFAEFGQFKHKMLDILDGKFEEFEDYILDKITQIDRLFVINPLNGKYEGIQVVLYDIVNLIERSYGITARDYDELKITAAEYRDKRITAIDYTAKAYFIFKLQEVFRMINPFTGRLDDMKNVIKRLVDFHRNAPTAEHYDTTINISAVNYDGRNITANNYDFGGAL